ncbi:RSPO2 protein, partial [Polyodon spathula]|nr:RSPO2 protein [Polyodon spathula]
MCATRTCNRRCVARQPVEQVGSPSAELIKLDSSTCVTHRRFCPRFSTNHGVQSENVRECKAGFHLFKGKCLSNCPDGTAPHLTDCIEGCEAGQWSEWTVCTNNGNLCGHRWGTQSRSKEIVRKETEEAASCPALSETKRCRMKKRCPGAPVRWSVCGCDLPLFSLSLHLCLCLVPALDGHNWAGCPYNQAQEEVPCSPRASGATPLPPAPPPSPPSQEIWDWLMHPEADLVHDLPIVINTLWRRDGERPGLTSEKVEQDGCKAGCVKPGLKSQLRGLENVNITQTSMWKRHPKYPAPHG